MVATLFCVCLAVASAGVGEGARVRVASDVNANWRGAYDILVRPRGARLNLEQTYGLVEPNFLGFMGRGGISQVQLESMRSLAEVELAAPVAVVGLVRAVVTSPSIFVSKPPDRPTLYQVRIDAFTSDGIADRLVQAQTAELLLGPSTIGDEFPWASSLGDISRDSEGITFTSRVPLPAIASPMIGVDPVAERALLGPSAEFLDSLVGIRSGAAPLTVSTFNSKLIHDNYRVAELTLDMLVEGGGASLQRPVVPLSVSRRLYAPLKLSLQIDQVGEALDAYPAGETEEARLVAARRAAGTASRNIGRVELDVTEELRPFQAPSLTLLWPGSEPPSGTLISSEVARDFEVRLPGRPRYRAIAPRTGSTALSYSIEPAGIASPDSGTTPLVPTSPDVAFGVVERGKEAVYRTLDTLPLAAAQGVRLEGDLDAPFFLAPLGEYDLAQLELPQNQLSYVPLGAYDPPSTTLVADNVGEPLPPVEIKPTFNAAGLVAVPPLAVTDIEGAAVLRGDNPIDAVRVRVKGLSDYGAEARTTVEGVATEIAGMGFDTDIVAGSSARPVEVFVPGYWVERKPVEDLGWVEQGWTTIGAARRVESGLGLTNTVLLALGVIAALVFAATLHVTELKSRASEIAVLHGVGWNRLTIARWILAELVLSALVVAAVGTSAWLLSERSAITLAAILLLVAVLPLAGVLQTAALLRFVRMGDASTMGVGEPPAAIVLPIRGMFSYSLRTLTSRRVRSAVILFASVTGGTAAGLSAALVEAAATVAGPTLLARFSVANVQPFQLALLLLTTGGAVVLAAVLVRMDIRDRRDEAQVFLASGWAPAAWVRLLRITYGLLACVAAVCAALLMFALPPMLVDWSATLLSVLVAAVTSGLPVFLPGVMGASPER